MGGVKGVVGEVQASSGPSLEPLESRLLLSGDLIGTEMPAPLEASLGGSAVEVDLDCEDEQLPRSDPALILSYLASAQDQDDVANPVESSPSGTDTLPDTQDELGTTVEAPVDSDGVALPFQDESSFLIAVDPQDVISDPQHLPIDARGPPEQETVEAGANNSQALELFGVSPALFVENQGQWADSAVRYMHDGACLDVAVTDSGLWFQTSRQDPTLEEDAADLAAWDNHALQAKGADVQALLFSASFVGAEAVQPVGLRPSDSLFNYCVGEPAGWRQNVPSYEVAAYEGLYEGIDLHVQGLRSHVKYEFHVAPNADYRQIAICYEGIEGLSIASDGSLVVDLGHDWGVMRDDAPYIYQEINGQKVEVAGRFILLDDHTYSFEITGEMDPDHVLVIDPDLAWSTYLGGAASGDSGQGIAVDTTGNVYVTGYTASSDWVSGGYDTTLGGLDAFVAKLSSDGGHLWSTYVGGSNRDWAYDIAVDSAGSAYVTGETESSGWISGGYDTSYGGGNCDAFVVKLTSAGGHAWSTYLAGFHAEISDEIGRGIAVDADGAAYVTGVTMDSDYMSNGGPYDAFIAKLTSTGGHAWSTYLGGSDLDRGEAIALDNVGAVYVTGSTYSSGWVNGGFDTTKDGFTDGFVVKVTDAGDHVWSTYVGGSEYDRGYDIAVDLAGSVYVTGLTWSTGWVSGGYDTDDSERDIFVAKLSNRGDHEWSTYLGEADDAEPSAIAVDAAGNVYVTSVIKSSGWASGGFDTSYNGGYNDAYVVKLTTAGGHAWSSFLGGAEPDLVQAIAVDADGNVYVTGITSSPDWTSGGFDTTLSGACDAFVAKITPDMNPDPAPVIAPGLAWSSYLGGANDERSRGIAVDATGCIYTTGYTYSADWTSGGFDTDYDGVVCDAFVVKLSPTGEHCWSTYVGGSIADCGDAIAVDALGNVYVTGWTRSTGWTSGGFDTTHNGIDDVFVAKLSSSGEHLWSTYLGGSSDDRGYGIAVDCSGNVYVTGVTDSDGWTSGGFDTTHNGLTDAFVAKLSGSGEHLWSTYLGGSYWDLGSDIAVDRSGNVYVSGMSYMTDDGLPNYDAFVTALSGSGEHLWSTYLGGSNYESGTGIAVDATGCIYTTGYTSSAGWTSGGFDTTYNGGAPLGGDVFIAKLSSSGGHLWSTYLGGSSDDYGDGIAVDASGNVYATGRTDSDGWANGGLDTTHNGGSDAFLVKLNSSGGHFWSTYLGGDEDDYGWDIVVDTSGGVYVTGETESSGWTRDGYDTTYNGATEAFVEETTDAFVAKIASHTDPVQGVVTTPGLAWSSYLGGADDDRGNGIVVDTSGNVYMTGDTTSIGWANSGFDAIHNGGLDIFVAKLSAGGDHLWSTYLGGGDDDYGYGIALDASGNVYVTGITGSAAWTHGGFDTTYNGGDDVFVAKLSSGGDHLWSTYLGGCDDDFGYGIALDASGNVYVTGYTGSVGWTSGGFDTTYNGGDDVFVAKLSSGGDHLWSAYLGGSDDDGGYGIAVDASGNVCVTGGTCSAGWTSGGFDAIHNGGHDAFVVKLSPGGDHLWSTYMGGSALEFGFDIAADTSGSVYVAGFTYSGGWATGGFDTTYNGQGDAFVAKLGSDGDHLWSTYLGGSEYDYGSGIAVDASGQVCVMGFSYSAGWTSGGFDTTLDGGEDVFVAKLNATGTHLWSTYLGGSSYDGGNDIAVDASGSIYVTGSTGSVGWVSGGFDTTYNGSGSDAFVAKFTDEPALASLWSSYLGGSSDDYGYGVAVDGSGNVYVTGHSPSSGWASGGFDTTHNGGADAFVAKFSPSGTHLWSTYLGGSSDDFGSDIAVDGLGNVYLTGYTYSSGWTSGGFDPSHNGGADVFVAKLSASGSYLWSTYLGGSDNDYGMAIAVAGSDNICVTGRTDSADWTNEGFDTVYDGGSDAFVAKLNSSGTLLWSTYLGGSSFDYGAGIAVDASGKVYATGRSDSAGWASGGLDTTYNGGPDAFLVKLDSNGGHLWSTYLGGSGNDYGSGVAVDALGNVYVTGCSESTDWTSGSFGTTHNGAGDVFVAKFNGIGAHLWSTYLGGSAYDYGYDIALDAWSNVHVTGTTSSAGWTSGGFDTTFDAGDGFAAKLSSTGVHLWSTYVGGSGWDGAYGIAVDSLGGIYVAGYTSSAGWTSAGFDTTHNGSGDAFVVKITDAINVAQGKVATQSSTGWGGSADKAVDGNTDGVYADGSVTHTQYDANAWWQVDLGGLYQIDVINIWNRTDAGQGRLDDFYVFVSDVPFTSTDLTTTMNQDGIWSRHVVVSGGPCPNVSLATDTVGRYVRIQLADTDYLSLAEVRVFGEAVMLGTSVAQGQTATQSSTGWGGTAD